MWMAVAAPMLWPGLYVATVPFESGRVQLAAERMPSSTSRDMRHEDSDQDLDELPSSPHRKLMPGQKAGTRVTSSPSGYDAKHLNRLWGRLHGAKSETKGEKTHKSSGPEASRPTRWGR
jgi:hypothetical protein